MGRLPGSSLRGPPLSWLPAAPRRSIADALRPDTFAPASPAPSLDMQHSLQPGSLPLWQPSPPAVCSSRRSGSRRPRHARPLRFSTFPSGATAWCAGPLSNLSPARSASSCRASRLFLAPRPPLRSPSQPSPTAFPTCLVPLGPPSSSISTSPSYDRSTIWSRAVVPPSLLNPAPGPTPLTPCPLPTLTP